MIQEIIKKRTPIVGAICIFVMGFLFFYFLTEGLPFWMYGPDDFTFLAYSQIKSFSDLFNTLLTLNPDPVRGFLIDENILSQRIILVFFFKVASLIGGINPYAHYFIRGIIYGLVGVVVFYFLQRTTGRSILSMIGALFYITAPATFASGQWLADGEVILQLFIGITFVLFLYAFFTDWSFSRLIPWQFLIVFFSYLTIRTKANGLIIPLIMIIYILLIDYRKIKQWALCIGVILFLMYPYWTPFLFNVDTAKNIVTPFGKNTISYFIFNEDSTLDLGEQGPSLFLPLQHFRAMPKSLLSSFGFLGGWILIIAIIVTIYHLVKYIFLLHYLKDPISTEDRPPPVKDRMVCALRSGRSSSFLVIFHWLRKLSAKPLVKTPEGNPAFMKEKFILFFGLWSGITFLIMLGHLHDHVFDNPRYVAIALFPFSILAFSCYHTLIEHTKSLVWGQCPRKIHFGVLFIYALLLSTIVINTYHTSIKFRGGFLSRHIGMDTITKSMYSDYYGTNITNDIYLAMNGYCEFQSDSVPVRDLSLSELGFTFGASQGEITKENIQKITNNFNIAYLITLFRPLDKESIEINATLLKEFRSCDHQSLYCKFKNKIKKDIPFLFLYRVAPQNLSTYKDYSIICPFNNYEKKVT